MPHPMWGSRIIDGYVVDRSRLPAGSDILIADAAIDDHDIDLKRTRRAASESVARGERSEGDVPPLLMTPAAASTPATLAVRDGDGKLLRARDARADVGILQRFAERGIALRRVRYDDGSTAYVDARRVTELKGLPPAVQFREPPAHVRGGGQVFALGDHTTFTRVGSEETDMLLLVWSQRSSKSSTVPPTSRVTRPGTCTTGGTRT